MLYHSFYTQAAVDKDQKSLYKGFRCQAGHAYVQQSWFYSKLDSFKYLYDPIDYQSFEYRSRTYWIYFTSLLVVLFL